MSYCLSGISIIVLESSLNLSPARLLFFIVPFHPDFALLLNSRWPPELSGSPTFAFGLFLRNIVAIIIVFVVVVIVIMIPPFRIAPIVIVVVRIPKAVIWVIVVSWALGIGVIIILVITLIFTLVNAFLAGDTACGFRRTSHNGIATGQNTGYNQKS